MRASTLPRRKVFLFLLFLSVHLLAVAQLVPGPTYPSHDLWWSSVCRGERLSLAMTHSPPYAASYITPLDSPWVGPLIQELAAWGYTEHERPSMCEFDNFWGLGAVFKDLGLDSRSSERGGVNRCFYIGHGEPGIRDGGRLVGVGEQKYAVKGRVYRTTGSFTKIGINPSSGHVFFLGRRSASDAAALNWHTANPHKDELPALRATSDLAWGFWNSVTPPGMPVKAFWSICITNPKTLSIINLAVKTYTKTDDVRAWPGTEFGIESVEGQAILGSPNGIAAGFFLAQHKRQLGGNKMVYKITVFAAKNRATGDEFPHIIFWVRNAVDIYGRGINKTLESQKGIEKCSTTRLSVGGENVGGDRVVSQSEDGKHLLREWFLQN